MIPVIGPVGRAGEGGLGRVWEESLSYLQEREGRVGCLVWEGSLSYLQEREGRVGWAVSGRGAFLTFVYDNARGEGSRQWRAARRFNLHYSRGGECMWQSTCTRMVVDVR